MDSACSVCIGFPPYVHLCYASIINSEFQHDIRTRLLKHFSPSFSFFSGAPSQQNFLLLEAYHFIVIFGGIDLIAYPKWVIGEHVAESIFLL